MCFCVTSIVLAGVIVPQNGNNIEDVSNVVVSSNEVSFVENGVSRSLPIDQVSAVLYDDGRYEEIKSQQTSDNVAQEEFSNNSALEVDANAKEYNVCAYGVYAMFYAPAPKYDGAIVEYRIIYKSQKETPEFKYLGTTPFAYLTQKMYENNFSAKGDPNFQRLKELNPFVVENAKDVKTIEFRLSLDGYKTVIVKPIHDAFIGGGPVMFIPMQKLKPIK